ncbi:MAG TPA: NUDIX domain-containing protein [Thermoplasmata archaeon]|nr:NUDIX domain-containing protein [Thermoplasmata archaeon]
MKARSPRIAQECVEVYVFTRKPPRFLILRRPPSRASRWVPISGKVEKQDPTFFAAARRELKEETGFSRGLEIQGLRWCVTFRGPDRRRWRLHGYAAELHRPRPPRLSDEHVAFRWVDLGEALRRLSYADNRAAVLRLRRHVGLNQLGANPAQEPA